MAPSAIAQRRTHNLLLFQKLLNLRDGASPFTLILDTIEQSANPLLREFTSRAKIAKTKIVFISFRTFKKPKTADVFVRAHGKSTMTLAKEILGHVPESKTPQSKLSNISQKTLLIFDTLHPLANTNAAQLPVFLSSLLSPTTSILAIYHLDIPLLPKNSNPVSFYAPEPLSTLSYLATAILRISCLSHVLAQKKARDKSLPDPDFGLREGRDGVLVGLKGPGLAKGEDGVVVEMEVRRKSGRGVKEAFVLFTESSLDDKNNKTKEGVNRAGSSSSRRTTLLDDHPLFARPVEVGLGVTEQEGTKEGEGEVETTFSMGLTEKQRKDREGITLPYFDAQNGGGAGEGGRILYEMGREDDFDEDEDDEFA